MIPNFVKPKFSIKTTTRIAKKIGRTILEHEIGNKHQTKNKIKEQLLSSSNQLKSTLSYLEYKAIQYRLRSNISKRIKK